MNIIAYRFVDDNELNTDNMGIGTYMNVGFHHAN